MSNAPPWAGKMCPLLSMAGLSKQPSKILGAVSQGEAEAISCQGPNCMWMRPIADESGNVVAMECAVNLIALGGSQVANSLHQVITTFKKA